MAMPEESKMEYAMAYLRRTHTLPQLKALSVECFNEVSDVVTLTTNSYEGGSAGGTITFEKAVIGLACERLIAELEPSSQSPQKASRSMGVWPRWNGARTLG